MRKSERFVDGVLILSRVTDSIKQSKKINDKVNAINDFIVQLYKFSTNKRILSFDSQVLVLCAFDEVPLENLREVSTLDNVDYKPYDPDSLSLDKQLVSQCIKDRKNKPHYVTDQDRFEYSIVKKNTNLYQVLALVSFFMFASSGAVAIKAFDNYRNANFNYQSALDLEKSYRSDFASVDQYLTYANKSKELVDEIVIKQFDADQMPTDLFPGLSSVLSMDKFSELVSNKILLMSLRPSNLFWSIVVNNIFKGIRWRKLTILMVIFVLSFVALMTTVFFHQWSSDYIVSANKKLSSIENRIKTATKNSNVLYSNMKTLEAFYESGVLGEPLRLEWVKTLQAITDEYDIPVVEFTVNPTESENVDAYGVKKKSDTLATPMKLNIKMIHEGDFYRFLTALERRSRGFFKVDYCEIKRVSNNFHRSSTIVNFNAVCELTWFNYRDLRQEWFNREV